MKVGLEHGLERAKKGLCAQARGSFEPPEGGGLGWERGSRDRPVQRGWSKNSKNFFTHDTYLKMINAPGIILSRMFQDTPQPPRPARRGSPSARRGPHRVSPEGGGVGKVAQTTTPPPPPGANFFPSTPLRGYRQLILIIF